MNERHETRGGCLAGTSPGGGRIVSYVHAPLIYQLCCTIHESVILDMMLLYNSVCVVALRSRGENFNEGVVCDEGEAQAPKCPNVLLPSWQEQLTPNPRLNLHNADKAMEPPSPRGIFSNLFRKTTTPLPQTAPPVSAAAALPTPGTATSMDQEQERREQRLAKNRESARQSRRRKKEKLELLSERMCELNEELEDLRQATATSIGSLDVPAQEELHALRIYRFARLRRLISSPHIRFWMWLHRQSSTYAPSSSSSSSSTTSASKVGEHLMQLQQEQGGPQGWDARDGHKLWPLLCFELQLKGEQEERARALFGQASSVEMKEEVEALAGVIEAADALEKDLKVTTQHMQVRMAAVRRVLTPAQIKILEGG